MKVFLIAKTPIIISVVFLKWILKTHFVKWLCFPWAKSPRLVIIASLFCDCLIF